VFADLGCAACEQKEDVVMYLEPTRKTGRLLFERRTEGPITMLNLLRFRDTADYTAPPELAPEIGITGREAYDPYMEHTLSFLEAAGGKVSLIGHGGPNLIGPPEERWDLVLLVKHASLEAFMGMANDAGYLAGLGHRTASLADSRPLPIIEGY
jgi:uncharacterized protein (DUF1330 family)